MRTRLAWFALIATFCFQPPAGLRAACTIDIESSYAYSANLGWLDWRGDTNSGAVIGEYVCSGSIYSANAGWICLGAGSPTNSIRYQNLSADDFGVNHDGRGNLSGYAWGANIGWIAFATNGAPKVDLLTGDLSGYVWSANCGWLSLSNASAHVKTTSIAAGTDSDGDGLPDAWERENWGSLMSLPDVDSDGDGASNYEEYLAGTNPRNASDFLRITAITRDSSPGTYTTLTWPGKMTRFYAAQRRNTLDPSDSWVEFYTAAYPGQSWLGFDVTTTQQFLRIRAFRPLMP
jgi:hypothetical protein